MKQIIKEYELTQIIKESVYRCLMEGVKLSQIGESGPLNVMQLADPQDIDNGRDFERERDEYCQKVGRRMTNDEMKQLFGDSKWYQIWKQYCDAMYSSGDPNKKARGFFGFIDQMKSGKLGMPIKIYQYQDSYLLGMVKELNTGNGRNVLFFWPAYFSPNTKIQGYKMIADICQYNNIIFTVTDDIASMLERIGLYKMPDPFYAKWRGHACDKQLYSTSKIITDPRVSYFISRASKEIASR